MDEIIEPKKTINKYLILVICVLAIGVIYLALCFLNEKKIYQVKSSGYQRSVKGIGVLKPVNQRKIYASTEGIVKSINLSEGDILEKGDIIISTSNDNLSEKLSTARLSVVKDKYSLAEKVTSKEDRLIELEYEKSKIESLKTRKVLEVNATKTLVEHGVISKLEYGKLKGELESLAIEENKLKKLISRVETQLIKLKKNVNSLNAEQEKAFGTLERQLESLSVKASIPGQLDDLDDALQPGAIVTKGQYLATIGDHRHWEVELEVSVHEANTISIGDNVFIEVQGEKFQGTLVAISPSAQNQMLKCTMILDEASSKFRNDLRVQASIEPNNTKDVLYISEVESDIDLGVVNVFVYSNENKKELIPIEIIDISNGKVTIRGDISANYKISFVE